MTTHGWGYPGPETDEDESGGPIVQFTPFEAELLDRLDRLAEAVEPLADTAIGGGRFGQLLDADPQTFSDAITAGADVLLVTAPLAFRGRGYQELRNIAETVIDAALKVAARSADAGGVDAPPASDPSAPGAAPTNP